MKRNVLLIVFILMIIMLPITAFAAAPGINSNVGGLGVNSYANCPYDDRAGASYLDSLMGRMPINITRSYAYKNDSAYPSRLINASTVDLFIYSGHGTVKGDTTCAHFSIPAHLTHSATTVESSEAASTSVAYYHPYVVMYTCNWLNYGTTQREINSWKTFKSGCRIQCGFGSQMYLDSREGNMFGYRMIDYVETIKTAFFNSALNYQPQNSVDVIARVATYNNAANDTYYSGYTGSVPGYASSPSSYMSYKITIPHN